MAHYGRLLFRRALEEDEIGRFAAIVGAAGDDADMLDMGMRYMFSALLQAPSFLYVPAIGAPVAGSDIRRFDGYEMASRLSLFLWNTIPDDALLAAAEAGELDTAEGVASQARRMLDDPKAADLAARFLEEAWHILDLTATSKHMERYPDWDGALLGDLRTEVRMVLGDLQEEGDFLEIFDGTQTYVNDRLAGFYGVDGAGQRLLAGRSRRRARRSADGGGGHRRELTVGSQHTHRARRLHPREPPLPRDPGAARRLRSRQVWSSSPCSSRATSAASSSRASTTPRAADVTRRFDPLGMALDDYDAIGRFRTGGDSIGELPGEPFVDVHDLAASLRGEGEASRCLTKRLLGFGGAHEIVDGEEVIIHEVTADFEAGGHTFESLVVSLVASDGFRFLSPEH